MDHAERDKKIFILAFLSITYFITSNSCISLPSSASLTPKLLNAAQAAVMLSKR